MSGFGRMTRIGVAGVVLCATTACTTLYRDHGYAPTEHDLAEIKVGADTRQTVSEKIGAPGTTGVLVDSGWYYVQSRYSQFAFQAPKEVERQVVAISFDKRGVVTNVERFGLEKGEVVTLSRRVTDSNTRGVGFLKQLLGSLGRVNAAQIFNRPGSGAP